MRQRRCTTRKGSGNGSVPLKSVHLLFRVQVRDAQVHCNAPMPVGERRKDMKSLRCGWELAHRHAGHAADEARPLRVAVENHLSHTNRPMAPWAAGSCYSPGTIV